MFAAVREHLFAPGFFQRRVLQVCLLIVGRHPRIAVFHVFIVGQAFGTGKPAFSAGAPFVPKLTLSETGRGIGRYRRNGLFCRETFGEGREVAWSSNRYSGQ
jgi:hypothetical protein